MPQYRYSQNRESLAAQGLGILGGVTQRPDINQLSADQLRALATELMDSLDAKDEVLGLKERELVRSNAIIEKLTHEVAILKRHKYARRSEQLDADGATLVRDRLVAR